MAACVRSLQRVLSSEERKLELPGRQTRWEVALKFVQFLPGYLPPVGRAPVSAQLGPSRDKGSQKQEYLCV